MNHSLIGEGGSIVVGRLHHIGFVVPQIPNGMIALSHILGARWDGEIFEDPHQNVKVAFLTTASGMPHIELVQPNGEKSPVHEFLRSRGGGLHHLCYEVSDLDLSLRQTRARGAWLVKRPLPAVALGGRRIAWIMTPEKLLLELLEAE